VTVAFTRWYSPLTGRALVADTPHSLAAIGERWPVVDGIPYLRIESEGLVAVALDHLDAGCPDDALVALLTDQDAWWTGPATDLGELKRLVRERDTLSLREAMALLRMGPVADYFAHRWSDPTYLAGLALIEAYWQAPATAFELACGIGHYLRELTARGVTCLGGDVVFAKCWLAKHWVAPLAEYVVFDAAADWPVAGRRFDLVQCHDAFYFLPDQPRVAMRLRDAVAPGGVLAVSHLHNVDVACGAKGPARHGAEWAALFPDATIHDEREMRRALLAGDAPAPTDWSDDPGIEAWSLVEGTTAPARALTGGLAVPAAGAALRPNPLLVEGVPHWPSNRYRDEYGDTCTWATATGDPARTRRLLDLPVRW
jgi:SAM-dependent methyltransferase